MTINLQTLKCAECGSSVLRRTGLNQYVCEHCGSVSVVEDDVSERLDRVLDQVKDAAADRLSAEQRVRQQQAVRTAAYVVAGLVGVMILTVLVTTFLGNRRGGSRPVAALERPIPVDQLKLGEVREVLVGFAGSQRTKLLVVARNETGKVLERPSVAAVFYDGENKLGNDRETLPGDLLMPGESAPVLLDMPSGEGRVTRQELKVERLSEPYSSAEGPPLTFSRVRLVTQAPDELRLAGRLVNTRQGVNIAGVQVLVNLYDERGAVIGFGLGYAQASELKSGEQTQVDVRLSRFGVTVPIAAWDYRIGYSVLGEGGARSSVRSAQRVVRTTGGPESLNPDLRLSLEDLLADDSERFDLAQLELLPLIPGVNTIRQRTYMTELVNRSKDMIAVTPAALISRFDGNQLDGVTRVDGLAYLYPGERLPIQVDPKQADRITQTRVEWKPLRKAPLPGPRQPLEIRVEGTKAELGSVLLNFSQRFVYKAVTVKGSVKNADVRIVRKPKIWVSLRDRQGKLTGFKAVENLSAIAPGESLPFEVRIEQQGGDFATVDTVYQTGD